MATRICILCGDILESGAREGAVCDLCRHRSLPDERVALTRRLSGLLDSA